MNLNLFNYLEELKQIITGSGVGPSGAGVGVAPSTQGGNCAADGGYLRDQDISYSMRTLSGVTTGVASTGGVLPVTVTLANAVIPSTGSLILGPYHINRDYDQTSDVLQFRFTGSITGATEANAAISAWLLPYTPGLSTETATTPQNSSTVFSTSFLTAFSVSLSGNGLAQDDIIYLYLSTASEPITLYGGALVYAATQVAWDMYGVELVGTSSQQIRG